MIFKFLTDLVIVLHFVFILFVIIGGWVVLKWEKLIWIHIPACLWGAIVEYVNIICPLTPLENYFRELSAETTYNAGFIDHYLAPVIYPEGLDRNLQIMYGSIVVIINLIAYSIYIGRIRKTRKRKSNQLHNE